MKSAKNLCTRNSDIKILGIRFRIRSIAIIILVVLTLAFSITSLIRISHISLLYTDRTARDAVLASTTSLESRSGVLLSTIHLKDITKDDYDRNIVISHYSFRYFSIVTECTAKDIYVYYDTDAKAVVDTIIPFEEKNETICK